MKERRPELREPVGDAELSRLFAQVKRLDTSVAQRERVWARLAAGPVAPAGLARAWPWAAVGGATVLVAVAAALVLRAPPPRPVPVEAIPAPSVIAPPAPVPSPEPPVVPAPHAPERHPHASRPVAPVVESPAAPAIAERPVAPSPPAVPELREHDLIGAAIQHLRQKEDAQGALTILDEHRQRFPHGMLTGEADRLRVEALVRLGRDARALQELDAMTLDSVATTDLQIERGELRAAAGRCPEALSDFAEVLERDLPEARLLERLLWGRCVCAAKAETGAAQRALRSYLDHFPKGPHASAARQALETQP